MRIRVSDALGAIVMLVVSLSAALIVVLSLASCSDNTEGTWPESAEFSTLESGQGRFSAHDTNVASCDVVVDHETGVEYLVWMGVDKGGVCPLLDADGTPMTVLEAGE